jgi:hypothetical protein
MANRRKRKVSEHHIQSHQRRLTKLSHTAHVAIDTATRPDPLDLSASSPEQGAMTLLAVANTAESRGQHYELSTP